MSRVAFEAHLAALFNLVAIVIFLKSLKVRWYLPLAVFFFGLSFYTFNANRIIAPLLLGLMLVVYIKELWQSKLWLLVSAVVGLIMIWPSVGYLETRESRLRFQEVSIFTSLDVVKKSNDRIARSGNTWWAKLLFNRRIYFAEEFLIHYLDNFRGDFLFVVGDRNPRLATQDLGELYPYELPLLLAGIYFLLKRPSRETALFWGWMLIAPIPAGMARETPHMLRIASIIPTWQILVGIGVVQGILWLKEQKAYLKWAVGVGYSILILGCLSYYFHNYWIHYPRDWSSEWQYGYKQLVEKVNRLEPNYDRIYITNDLGRPYIYFLLYNQIDPLVYIAERKAERDWYGFWTVFGFGKYDFSGSQKETGRVLVVGGKDTFVHSGKKLDTVMAPDGSAIFDIGEP